MQTSLEDLEEGKWSADDRTSHEWGIAHPEKKHKNQLQRQAEAEVAAKNPGKGRKVRRSTISFVNDPDVGDISHRAKLLRKYLTERRDIYKYCGDHYALRYYALSLPIILTTSVCSVLISIWPDGFQPFQRKAITSSLSAIATVMTAIEVLMKNGSKMDAFHSSAQCIDGLVSKLDFITRYQMVPTHTAIQMNAMIKDLGEKMTEIRSCAPPISMRLELKAREMITKRQEYLKEHLMTEPPTDVHILRYASHAGGASYDAAMNAVSSVPGAFFTKGAHGVGESNTPLFPENAMSPAHYMSQNAWAQISLAPRSPHPPQSLTQAAYCIGESGMVNFPAAVAAPMGHMSPTAASHNHKNASDQAVVCTSNQESDDHLPRYLEHKQPRTNWLGASLDHDLPGQVA